MPNQVQDGRLAAIDTQLAAVRKLIDERGKPFADLISDVHDLKAWRARSLGVVIATALCVASVVAFSAAAVVAQISRVEMAIMLTREAVATNREAILKIPK